MSIGTVLFGYPYAGALVHEYTAAEHVDLLPFGLV